MKIFQPIVTGSLNISGSVTATSFTGSLFGTASYAITASYAMNGGVGGNSFPYTGSAGISGSLIVNGTIEATQGITGSLYGSASYAMNATTASYLLGGVVSASFADNSINTINAQSGSNFVVTTTLRIDGALMDYATILSTIVGDNNLFTRPTGSFTAAFCKYTTFNEGSSRVGEFIVNRNGTSVVFTDISTTDIGDTTNISFSAAVVTGELQINAVAAASGWGVKAIVTYI